MYFLREPNSAAFAENFIALISSHNSDKDFYGPIERPITQALSDPWLRR